MFVQRTSAGGTRLVTSASDLTAASECEFAFLRRVDAKLGRDVTVPDSADAMRERAARLGDLHEARTLEAYREQLGAGVAGESGGVVEIPRHTSMSEGELARLASLSAEALRGGAELVFQATFFEPSQAHAGDLEVGFVGFADFLRRTRDGAIEVQDTKLARRARVTALLQLAAYAEQLERLGLTVSDTAVLLLGDGSRSEHRLADIAPVFRARRARLHSLLHERVLAVGSDGSRESASPVAWGQADIAACGTCEVCEPEVERTRDPLLIAGLRRLQRDRLIAAGLDTIDEIAGLDLTDLPDVDGVSGQVLARIAAQADAQVETERLKSVQAATAAPAVPAVQIARPEALAAIPAPSPGDLFFDFEGDPLYREPGGSSNARWGIDYLFGMVDTSETFTALWAHDLEAERDALVKFLELVAQRRAQFPEMKIYHYAAYERTHLSSIAARHGVGEAEVDQLLREHVLVDLYPIVKQALIVGSRSYSIKKLEPLYMGDEFRDEDGVTSGGESVAEYARAMALLSSSEPEDRLAGERVLDSIADYNRYDCVSTLRLRDWLRELAQQHGVVPFPEHERNSAQELPELELSEVAAKLAAHAAHAPDERDRRAAALGGSAIDYHQREQKSFWHAHYARLVDPVEEWAETRDVLIVDSARSSVANDWHRPPRARKDRRTLILRGDFAPGSGAKADTQVFLVYAYPAPFTNAGARPGARVTATVRVVEVLDDGVVVDELLSDEQQPHWQLPIAVTPGPPPPPGAQKGAIEEWGQMFGAALDTGYFPSDPVVDVLRRNRPRSSHQSLTDPASPEALEAGGGDEAHRTIGAVIESVKSLTHSALAVQGPPGTGKTYLAARVIKHLVEREGWHIGVVAQSHRVVENVLDAVVSAGLDPRQVGKVPQGGKRPGDTPPPTYTELPKNGHTRFVSELRDLGRGSVTGGTAWDFSNVTRYPRKSLDLLVIDEAGQFSLAPTIAASMAAECLLLLGDPQQLPQVSQGSHPEPVDTSALAWVLGDHETLPADRGYFLAETRRMHPALASVVSELSYEGRLAAHLSTASRVVFDASAAGLHWHPVAHHGNATSSPEEAEKVVELVRRELCGSLAVAREGSEAGAQGTAGAADRSNARPLTQADLIVVAAYNAQVETLHEALSAAGYADVRVGTVDRFQGQEAAIAIVSLAASSAEDVPRGLEFLLMRNRLNVAISRAQWAAHLVSSPRLGDALPHTPEGVAALSGYLRLTERGAAGSETEVA